MPADLLKSYAKRANVSIDQVEKYWSWAKEQADKKFKERGPEYWAYVNKLTEIRLGLKKIHETIGFREFLEQDFHK